MQDVLLLVGILCMIRVLPKLAVELPDRTIVAGGQGRQDCYPLRITGMWSPNCEGSFATIAPRAQ